MKCNSVILLFLCRVSRSGGLLLTQEVSVFLSLESLIVENRSDWVTGYYARCFSSFYNCFCFELFEVFKDPEFEADLPSSAPVYLQFVWGSCFRVGCQMSSVVLSEYLPSCLRIFTVLAELPSSAPISVGWAEYGRL